MLRGLSDETLAQYEVILEQATVAALERVCDRVARSLAEPVLVAHLPGKHDQREHGRRRRLASETVSPSALSKQGIGGLAQGPAPSSATKAAKASNPHYGSTNGTGQTYRDAGRAGSRYTPDMGPLPSGAYEENCTNSVMAFEMRMRGYQVEAAPMDILDRYGYAGGRTHQEVDDLLSRSWTLPDGSPHGRSLGSQTWRSFSDIDREIEQTWPEGGRGSIFVGKHVFSVVKTGGKAKYVEPQFDASPTRIVTAQYKKKFSTPRSVFGPQDAKLVRLDDLIPADGILQTVVASVT